MLQTETIVAGDTFTFDTDAGALDILDTPAGTTGYRALAARSQQVEIEDMQISVASLDDLIAMKEAGGRPKDLQAVEVLAALRDELG